MTSFMNGPKGVKHKVDDKGIDIKKLLTANLRTSTLTVHQGLPYNQMQIRPKVESWMYNVVCM